MLKNRSKKLLHPDPDLPVTTVTMVYLFIVEWKIYREFRYELRQ